MTPMKSILIIGLGRFGKHLSIKFSELDNDVLCIDKDEDSVNEVAPYVTEARIGDCTRMDVLKELGVDNFDLVFVCIGSDLPANLLITSNLKDIGAKTVISKAKDDNHAKLLSRIGADEVVYPERSYANKVAARYTMDNVYEMLELDENFYICEIPTAEQWVGETVSSLSFRTRYKVNILGTKRIGEKMRPMPGVEHVFSSDEHLVVLGSKKDINKLIKQI